MADASNGGAVSRQQRQAARQQGHVPVSRELVFALCFAMAGVTLGWRTPMIVASLRELMIVQIGTAAEVTHVAGSDDLLRLLSTFAVAITPVMAVIALTAALAHWLQHGPLWVPSRLLPDIGRVDPSVGWQRLLHRGSLATFAVGVLRLGLLSGTVVWIITGQADDVVGLAYVPATRLVGQVGRQLMRVISAVVVALLVAGLTDLATRIWQYERKLLADSEQQSEQVRAVHNDVMRSQSRR